MAMSRVCMRPISWGQPDSTVKLSQLKIWVNNLENVNNLRGFI